jgi:hypothetical protein
MEGKMVGLIVTFILAGLLLILYFTGIIPSIGRQIKDVNTKLVCTELDNCIKQKEEMDERGTIYAKGKDGLPWGCSPCVSPNSDYLEDKDGDCMPDFCDSAPEDKRVFSCKKGMYSSKDGSKCCADSSCDGVECWKYCGKDAKKV